MAAPLIWLLLTTPNAESLVGRWRAEHDVASALVGRNRDRCVSAVPSAVRAVWTCLPTSKTLAVSQYSVRPSGKSLADVA